MKVKNLNFIFSTCPSVELVMKFFIALYTDDVKILKFFLFEKQKAMLLTMLAMWCSRIIAPFLWVEFVSPCAKEECSLDQDKRIF